MNQNFNSMPFLKPLILNYTKNLTTRLETPFRLKCDVGDIMHWFTGLRTEKAHKFADAIVLRRGCWNQSVLSNANNLGLVGLCFEKQPIESGGWKEFSRREGFNSIEKFVEWFTQERYEGQNLITYEFTLMEVF